MGSGHQYRMRIRKPSGAEVPADTFLDPAFSDISAVWAVDVDEMLVMDEMRPMAVVHNPMARTALPPKFLPAQSEYFADVNADYYELRREDGVLV
jgi:type I restriction enzyme S subunit